jgi:C4-dicarboxylate-specific signal transduction histidine kinase
MLHSSEEHSRLYGFDLDSEEPSFDEFTQRVHPDDRALLHDAYERAIRAGSDVNVHYRIVLPDGTTRHVQAVGHPVVTPSGEAGEFAGFLMDVTERRRADEERERLRQAQADLAHVSRMTTMGELTASLAHEVNQPIAAAVTDANTCLRWLQRQTPDLEEAREAAKRVVRDATRAADIISRIRQFFRKGVTEREPVDVNDVVREIVALLRGEAARFGISVRTDLAADVSPVSGDRVQLQQVMTNLMMNSFDAMKDVDGTRELVITSRPANGDVMISVADTGVGVLAQHADQIFNAFFTTKLDGTGMGLSISRSIVQSHGGRLWATGNSGPGVTLHFTMPTMIAARA